MYTRTHTHTRTHTNVQTHTHTQTCKQGVWIWGQPLMVDETPVMLMDMEGFGGLGAFSPSGTHEHCTEQLFWQKCTLCASSVCLCTHVFTLAMCVCIPFLVPLHQRRTLPMRRCSSLSCHRLHTSWSTTLQTLTACTSATLR